MLEQLACVERTKRRHESDYSSGSVVDEALLLNWKVKARNLLSSACGKNSEHYCQFVECEKPRPFRSSWDEFIELKAVFEAAREDYDGGYLVGVRSLIQAEVFDGELDQARELLLAGYRVAAAVVAGVVLETALRQLCTDAGIATGKLDRMNADLAKAGIYNLLVQKRITALADIRNNAAHGHPDRFGDSDVADMISYVNTFLADRL